MKNALDDTKMEVTVKEYTEIMDAILDSIQVLHTVVSKLITTPSMMEERNINDERIIFDEKTILMLKLVSISLKAAVNFDEEAVPSPLNTWGDAMKKNLAVLFAECISILSEIFGKEYTTDIGCKKENEVVIIRVESYDKIIEVIALIEYGILYFSTRHMLDSSLVI